ncbi:MAG TPA: glycerate kinase [Candidatus Bathyarchaeia archaeon]|nr:glycerate kinase [Candidatus Bathyarchaeia archaeon]
MIQIRNKDKLVENGETEKTRKARTIALRTLEHALSAVDAAKLLKLKVTLDGHTLHAGTYSFDLGKFRNVYVLGGGKASGSMASALEDVLGKRITAGFVNVPHGDSHKTRIIRLHDASHPIPDEAGVAGTRQMLVLAEEADEDDLVITLISGGGSSLMPMPREGISLQDKRELTDRLLKSGANISEFNVVRKHLSSFKGGWLAKKAYPATILNLILSDVVGDSLESIASGPTVPDSTTYADAHRILHKYGLWDNAPSSIRTLFLSGERGDVPENPKQGDAVFEKVYSVILGNSRSAALAAIEHIRFEGLNSLLLTSTLEGEARTVGTILSSIANEVAESSNPIPKPAGLVAGGETVVTGRGKGVGGRNQELALSAALKLQGVEGAVVASLNTDGVDGPTDAAGAIVDGKTVERAMRLDLNPEEYLARNDSHSFFSKLGDLIVTGPTGTNVNDISLIIIL